MPKKSRKSRKPRGLFREHSLSLAAVATLVLWITLYSRSDPETHAGAFFGNAVADWSGVVLAVVGTKYLIEKGSKESRQIAPPKRGAFVCLLIEHSLSIFLAVTGLAWFILYSRMEPGSRWGQVVGNICSEWVQLLGLVLLTKGLFERGSKESN